MLIAVLVVGCGGGCPTEDFSLRFGFTQEHLDNQLGASNVDADAVVCEDLCAPMGDDPDPGCSFEDPEEDEVVAVTCSYEDVVVECG